MEISQGRVSVVEVEVDAEQRQHVGVGDDGNGDVVFLIELDVWRAVLKEGTNGLDTQTDEAELSVRPGAGVELAEGVREGPARDS